LALVVYPAFVHPASVRAQLLLK